jgi:biopolymer transport protein ExbD
MAMSAGPADSGDEDEIIASINTTPLVDVMLVLLIIFLITIPAIVQQVPLVLPKEANVPTQTKPENIVIAVNRDGDMFWNGKYVKDTSELFERLKPIAVLVPQPEIHIRADQNVRYEYVGKVVVALQRASILKIGFITEPPIRG